MSTTHQRRSKKTPGRRSRDASRKRGPHRSRPKATHAPNIPPPAPATGPSDTASAAIH
jgi:hypothetical protein